jgi:hypothetical protein
LDPDSLKEFTKEELLSYLIHFGTLISCCLWMLKRAPHSISSCESNNQNFICYEHSRTSSKQFTFSIQFT